MLWLEKLNVYNEYRSLQVSPVLGPENATHIHSLFNVNMQSAKVKGKYCIYFPDNQL